MKEKIIKMKVWFEEHKDEIAKEAIRVSWYLLGLGVGYFVGNKLSEWKMGYGLAGLHNDGIMKFFDPAKGIEVGIDEARNISKRMYNK